MSYFLLTQITQVSRLFPEKVKGLVILPHIPNPIKDQKSPLGKGKEYKVLASLGTL